MGSVARWWREAKEAATAYVSASSWIAWHWGVSGMLIGVTAGYLMARWWK